jgi:hypothetical protein
MIKVRSHKIAVNCLIIISLCGLALADDSTREKAAGSISEAELRDHIYFLSSDYLEGRLPGEQGYTIAAEYAATQFRAAGLKELQSGEQTASFLQAVPMQRIRYAAGSHLAIKMNGGEEIFEQGEKILIVSPGEGQAKLASPVPLFLGYAIHEPESGWDDLAGIDVNGRLVIFMPGVPYKEGKPLLPVELNKEYESEISGIIKKTKTLVEKGVAGIIIIPDLNIAVGWNILRDMLEQRGISLVGSGGGNGFMDSPVPLVIAHPNLVKSIFAGRDFDPLSGKGKYGTFELTGTEVELKIEDEKTLFDSFNVVGIVEGSDPELKHEYVTAGAHLDHLGMRKGEVFNGADDNASGCSAILEAAEAVAMNPPRRSVLFVLYTGEELGLLGSQYFVDHCPVPLESIVANINLDEVGRSDAKPAGLLVIGSQTVCPELKQLVIAANEQSAHADLNFTTDESDPLSYFDRSDQVNFYHKGIPVVFLSCGEHNDYHTPRDDAELIDFKYLRNAALLTYEVIMELGNRDERICPNR